MEELSIGGIMKHALIALFVSVFALSSFADDPKRPGRHHRNPRRHGPVIVVRPRPVPPVIIRPRPIPPTRMCQVVMTDRYNRVVRRYWGNMNGNGMCREGLRQCNYDLNRMGMWGFRCATVRW